MGIYQKSNSQVEPPVIINQHSLEKKLTNFWELAKRVARNKANKKEKEKLEEKLDSLLDIISCKCDIKRCAETECCPQCPSQVHINCTCPKKDKIPKLELSFVLTQRTKKGEKGEIMIAGADFAEDAKQTAKQERN